nr:putative ribonuclease H-like domain-containing protein [Tanacetum cinerariifolium]
ECRAPRNQGNTNRDARYSNRDNNKRIVPVESSDTLVVQDNALIVQDGLGYDWSYIAQEEPTKFALMAYTSGSDIEKHEVAYEEKIAVLEFKVKDKGLDDYVYRPTTNKASASISKGEPSVIKTANISVEMPKVDSVRTSGVIIKDWDSDDEDTLVDTQVDSQTTVKPSFKKIKFTKARNEFVKSDKQADKPKMGNPQQALKYKGMFDSGCFRHMTGNKALLTDYQDIDRGFVAFGGSSKGGKITEIENQINKKVKVIRSDNGTEFKNKEMDELFRQKGIKREYIVARTPQQNRVAERKNMTLIEAARTMLADSLLPTIFLAEVVNTACYVLNKVLVTKPHNKTPYELIISRPPSISFMRPCGCHVTILNTLDPLGKFYGKDEEVTAWNQANKNAGHKEVNGDTCLKKNVDVGHTKPDKVSTQQYILFPLWSSISLSYKSSDDKVEDNTANDATGKENVQEPVSEYDQALKNVLERMMNQEKEAIKQLDDFRKEFQAQCNSQLLQEKVTRSNSITTVSTPVNTASASRTCIPPHDPLMPKLEDTAKIQTTGIFGNAYDEDDLKITIILMLKRVHIKYALTENPTIYASFIKQFWQTAALSIIKDGVMAITTTIDRNVKLLITEVSIRRHLKLGNSEGLSTLPTEEIFHQLALIGIVISEDEDAEDPSKQGRSLIEELDMDADISLVPLRAADQGRKLDDTQVSGQHEDQLGVFSAAKSEPTKKIKNRIQVQMSIDEELAQKLHEEELARFNVEQEAIDIERKEKVIDEGDQAHDIDWSDPSVIRYYTLQNRPKSVAKVRKKVQRSKRTVQEVKRQSTKEEKGKKSDDSSRPTRKKTLSRKRAGGNDSQESVKKQKLEDDTKNVRSLLYGSLTLKQI